MAKDLKKQAGKLVEPASKARKEFDSMVASQDGKKGKGKK